MSGRRVLITGATGFIGRQVLAPLRERGFEVHAVSSRSGADGGGEIVGGGEVGGGGGVGGGGEVAWYHSDLPRSPTTESSARGPSREVPWYHADLPRSTSTTTSAGDSDEIAWHHADLLEPSAAQTLIETVAPTHLLHLAWYAEPGKYWQATENLRWVEASLALLRAFAQGGAVPRRAVVAGTSAEYAWSRRTHCVEGETPLEPATLYGASKRALHLVAERFAGQAGMSLAWGRIFFVYGPGENPLRMAASVARALVRGEPAETTHGEQLRDFLHTADLGDAFAALLASDVEGPVNMASGEPVRVRDLVEALAGAAGRPELVRLGARPVALDEPIELTADTSRLRDEVGWTPTGSLAQRAAETIAWWRQRSWPDLEPSTSG